MSKADRYISQNALIKEIAKIRGNLSTKNVGQAIWDTPTADVVEVRHGEWISESFISKTGEKLYHTPMCSVCNQRTSFRSKFCPDCGAKMDGRREENEGNTF